MVDDAGAKRLADLERDLRFRIASGEFDQWIEAGESLSSAPPWYHAALEIVRLRAAILDETIEQVARALYRAELDTLDARLRAAQERGEKDPITHQFDAISKNNYTFRRDASRQPFRGAISVVHRERARCGL